MRIFIAVFFFVSAVASSASAAGHDGAADFFPARPAPDPWHVDWLSKDGDAARVNSAGRLIISPIVFEQTSQPVHAAAIEHSDAYLLRAKIHRYASFATLPLFATELALGSAIYDGAGEGDWKKGLHGAVGGTIVGLFAVNSVTGVWNLVEGRNDPGRGKRLLHGLLMLAADAGFAATAMSAPGEHENGRGSFTSDRATHRNLAIASIGTGTAGYLVMLLGSH